GRSATRSLAGRSGAGLSGGGLVRAVQNTQAMPDALKNIAVDIAGAAGAASAAINNLHGVLRLLARDHRRIQTLLGYALHGEADAQEGLWRQARRELIAHERAEVDVVLDLLHPSGKYEGLVERHRHDVAVLERRVREIDEAEVGSETWTRALSELRDAVRDHTFEEEAELFHWIESDLGRSGVDAAVGRVEAAKARVFASGEQSTILSATSDGRERS